MPRSDDSIAANIEPVSTYCKLEFKQMHLMRLRRCVAFAIGTLGFGCATPPTDSHSAADTFRKFLLAVETPLQRRLATLDMEAEIESDVFSVNETIRVKNPPGNWIRFGRIRIHDVSEPPIHAAWMTAIFDTSVFCIRMADLQPPGTSRPMFRPGPPIVVHGGRGAGFGVTELRPTGWIGEIPGPYGAIKIRLERFERDCITEIGYTFKFVK